MYQILSIYFHYNPLGLCFSPNITAHVSGLTKISSSYSTCDSAQKLAPSFHKAVRNAVMVVAELYCNTRSKTVPKVKLQ